jgi:DegV family protein with EDD domain
MPKVSIVTDSAAALDQETVERLGITVLPLTIHIGSETFREGIDITPEQFIARLRQPNTYPTISPPSIAEFHRVFEGLSQQSDVILALHVSGRLKNVLDTARRAAATFVGSSKIEIIDTETIAIGQGILVRAAAKAAANGQDVDDIIRLMRGMIPHMYSIFFVETLDYLKHDGRVDVAQAILGTMLGIKPLLTIEDGDIIPMEKVRTRERALEKLVEFIAEFSHIEEITILQDRYTDETSDLLERLRLLFADKEISLPIQTYGPSLAVHLGPTAMGAAIYEGVGGGNLAILGA